jgi:hypothetical protein
MAGFSILVLVFGNQLCRAQSGPEPLKLGSVTAQGSVRSRVEGWRWFEEQSNSDYAFSGSFLRLMLSHPSDRFDWQLELEAPILLGLPSDALGPGAQGQLGLGATY